MKLAPLLLERRRRRWLLRAEWGAVRGHPHVLALE
eukprot:COSAG06_NODE_31794_length_515_cov_1.689904_2_plen_34_part_01